MRPRKDVFAGSSSLERFSARLAAGEEAGLFDRDVVEVLGEEALEAFRFAQKRLAGSYRKVTGEPVICHSADIALRARDLGYDARTVMVCLLHDVTEDLSRTLEDVQENLERIDRRFGPLVAGDARLLTNCYSLVLRSVAAEPARKAADDEPLGHSLARAVEAWRRRQAPTTAARFGTLLDRLQESLLQAPGEAAPPSPFPHRWRDPMHRLRHVAYRLYLEDINDSVRDRAPTSERPVQDVPVVVKALDLVDNLRTSDVANLASLENILLKAETFLDRSFFLHELLYQRSLTSFSSFIPLYDYVKHCLVEQLAERRVALGALADTRFVLLARYLVDEIERLGAKYKVRASPVDEMSRLRDHIRRLNRGEGLPPGTPEAPPPRLPTAAPTRPRKGLRRTGPFLPPVRRHPALQSWVFPRLSMANPSPVLPRRRR